MRLEAWRGPLSERPFRRYFVAVLINSLGSTAGTIALAFGVLERGSLTDLGIVFAAREAAQFILVLAGGVWADRLQRRYIIAGGNLAHAVAQGVIGLLLLTGEPPVAVIALLAVIAGGAQAFLRPAETGFMPELVSGDHLQAANSMMGTISSSATIVGAAIGGGLVAAIGPPTALLVDAATFAIAALLILGVGGGAARPSRGTSPLADLREGWAEFASRRWVWVMVINFTLFQMTFFPAMFVLGPFVFKEEFGGAGAWGLLLTIEAVGALVGSLLAARLVVRYPLRANNLAFIPVGVTLLALGLGAPLPVVLVAAAVTGVGFGLGNPYWALALQQHIPEEKLSRVSSFDWLGSTVLGPIGFVLVGPVAATTSPQAVMVGAAAVTMIISTAVLADRSVRDLALDPENE